MATLRGIKTRYPIDPLTEDVSVAAAARNQRVFFNTRMITIIITFIAILGAIPLLITLANPWVNAPATLTREQLLLAISISAGYVALSALLLFMIVSTFSAQSSFNEFYRKYIDLASQQSPLLNVVRHYQFCGEHLHFTARQASVICQKLLATENDVSDADEQSFLVTFLDTAKQIFGYYSGGKCSSCIKMIESRPQGDDFSQRVFTLARDRQSSFERGHIDKIEYLKSYDISSNTGFREIYDNRNSLLSHFFCNDLRKLAADGKYQNSNPEWSEHYNATVIVPIKPAEARVDASTVGFLCVDTLTGEFPREISISTLHTLAALLFVYFTGRNARNLRENGLLTSVEEKGVEKAGRARTTRSAESA